jgi:hypothetical protein
MQSIYYGKWYIYIYIYIGASKSLNGFAYTKRAHSPLISFAEMETMLKLPIAVFTANTTGRGGGKYKYSAMRNQKLWEYGNRSVGQTEVQFVTHKHKDGMCT